ncbi:hypothetical protein KI387_025527, partial [Taxus chinensis]
HALGVVFQSHEELKKGGKEVVLVYVAADRDEEVIHTLKRCGQENQIDGRCDMECFESVLKILPTDWLAVPFEPSSTFDVRAQLISSYRSGIFTLAFVSSDGKLHTKDGFKILDEWGVDAYPFTQERIQQLVHQSLHRASNQCLKSLLTTDTRDFLITPHGKEVADHTHGHRRSMQCWRKCLGR